MFKVWSRRVSNPWERGPKSAARHLDRPHEPRLECQDEETSSIVKLGPASALAYREVLIAWPPMGTNVLVFAKAVSVVRANISLKGMLLHSANLLIAVESLSAACYIESV